jgi:ATP-dependent Clp protease protease subunit
MSNKLNDIVELAHDYHINLSTKTTWITGEIDEEQADRLSKNLSILDSNQNNKPITIILDSSGGEVNQGLRMYNLICNCTNVVRIIVEGKAESMASIILQAGDERIMFADSHLMLHIGTEAFAEDHPENVKRWKAKAEIDTKRTEDIYLSRIKEKKKKFTRNQLKEMLNFDTILSPKEAMELGLVDRIETNV